MQTTQTIVNNPIRKPHKLSANQNAMFSRRTVVCLFFVILYVAVSESKNEGYKPAPNCARLECPPYTVVYSDKEFEIRTYSDALWVSSPKISKDSYRDASNEGFLTLFGYYKGNNKQKVKIDMTTPVLVDSENSSYTTYFYVPKQYQKSLPEPLTDAIKPVKLPKLKYVAVRRFGGFLSNDNVPKEVSSLKNSLKGTPYERAAALDLVTIAGYNSPFELLNRVNEVMVWFD